MLGSIKKFLGEDSLKQAIVVRNDLKMEKGKIAAQVAHASLASYLKSRIKNIDLSQKWIDFGMKKIVLKVSSEKELMEYFKKCKIAGIPSELIHDAGHTQVEAGTATCFGAGPWNETEIDKILGKLKLL
ncbi:MAG: aminoacyl-tRNA hydrolase [Candidatus ainarchaeum sp.]|nr:aminoacyl-tRNA hydrolase [Candidatus ainarchaeum sp.]